MKYKLHSSAFFILILTVLILAACGTQPGRRSPTPETAMLLGTPVMISDLAAEEAALTQDTQDADAQAVAAAKIVRANAQATLNSANATLGAAQTQEKNAADVIAANAQATLNSAASTQGAALTQDAIHQTQAAALATTDAAVVLNQQNKDQLAASTQTAVANLIATQTQSAEATSQWYVDQDRQRGEQMQGPVTFLAMLCLPIFVVLFVISVLWGYWRWVKVKQGPRILEIPVEKLQAPAAGAIEHRQDNSLVYFESEVIDHYNPLTKPDDQVGRWLDEVKTELQSSEEKEKDDNPDN